MSNRLTLPGHRPRRNTRVRNVVTGRIFPCCWADCDRDGSTDFQVQVPHDAPRFPGEMYVYIFCSEAHARFFVR